MVITMIGWMVAGIVIAGITCALFCPVRILFRCYGTPVIKVRYLFVTYPLYPKRPKRPSVQKQQTEKNQSEAQKKKEKLSLHETIDMVKDAMGPVWRALRSVRRHLVLNRLWLYIRIAGEDAAQTAISYGRLCAGVYSALAAARNVIHIKKTQFDLAPDFDAEDTTLEFEGALSVRLIFLLGAGIAALTGFLRNTMRRASLHPTYKPPTKQGNAQTGQTAGQPS